MSSVLVLGAGITGLTAAYDLHRRGVRPIVLEASARAGGLILTDKINGFTVEGGADSLLVEKPAALQLCDELGLTSQLLDVQPPGGAFVLRGSRLYALPKPSRLGIPLTWRALAQYDLLPLPARLRMAVEPLVRPGHGDDESVGAFFRRRFGSAAVDLIAQPLLGGIHAGDIEQLSMRALFPRLFLEERRRGRVAFADARQAAGGFRTFKDGMDTLIAALEQNLPPATIAFGCRAEQMEATPKGWRVRTGGTAFDGAAVILALPAHVAGKILETIDAEAARVCLAVPYASTASVAFAWPRASIDHPLAGTGFVVARRQTDVRITACTWVSSKWTHRAPQGFALLRAFLGGSHDPQVLDLSDDEMAAIAQRDLQRVLGINGPPVLTRVYRWTRAGAQYVVGHMARVDSMARRLSRHGMFVAGSGFRSIGIPDCVADGRAAAAAAAEFARPRSST